MKRIFSFITMICVLAALIPVQVTADAENSPYDNVFDLMCQLGILNGDDNGEARLMDNMTRAEFATVLKNILTINDRSDNDSSSEWKKNFYGENTDYEQLKFPEENTGINSFSDVTTTHWAYETVEYVRSVGLMTGVSDNMFCPDNNIKTTEAVKCFVSLLGYDDIVKSDGGYPDGYIRRAQKLKLYAHINTTDEYITRGAVAQLIKNCFDVSLLELSISGIKITYTSKPDQTFASEVLGLDKISGVVTDNGYTSLHGESSYGGNYLVINNTLLNIPRGKEYIDLIGRNVDCYYKNVGSDSEGTIAAICINGKDAVSEIDSDAIVSVSEDCTQITYQSTPGDYNKCNISDAYVIYNGNAVNTFNKDLFEIDCGSMTVIDTNNSEYGNIVIITEPETWYVGNVDIGETTIYNSIKKSNNVGSSEILKLELDDPDYVIKIFNNEGKREDFSSITKNSVLDVVRSKGDKIVSIFISDKIVSDFVVKETQLEDDKLIISDGEKNFELSNAYKNYPLRDEIRLNDNLTLYLNQDDKIAWTKKQSDADLNVAYMIKSGSDGKSGLRKKYLIRVYNAGGKVETIKLADRVKVSDNLGKESKYDAEDFIKYYVEYKGICRYTVNDESEVNYVEFPIQDKDTTINGKLHIIMETTEDTKETDGYFLANNINSFGGKALINSSSKVICYNPKASSDENAFGTNGYGYFADKSKNIVKLYTDMEGSPVGKYILTETESLTSTFDTKTAVSPVYIVKKVKGGKFPDGSFGDIIMATKTLLYEFADEELYIKDGCLENGIEIEAEDNSSGSIVHNKFDGNIEPGDLIRVSKDEDGFVEKIRIIWDENGADGEPHTPGIIPGMKRFYDTADYNTNPFAVSHTGTTLYSAADFSNGSIRVYYGFPYKIRDNAVVLSTFDLPMFGASDIDENKYLREVWNIVRVVVIDLTQDGKVKTRTGTAADIKPYDEFGQDCSRIVNVTRSATIVRMYVINGYYSK